MTRSQPRRISLLREMTWRLRRLGVWNVLTLLRILHPGDWRTAMRLWPGDGAERGGEIALRLRGLHRPIILRKGSSDPDVFWQVFVERQYALPRHVPGPVRCIIDAGANVGLSALYLLNSYQDAHVVALEPDPANASVARRNLEAYSERCTLVEGALWEADGVLQLQQGTFRDGREWATTVAPASATDGNVRAFSVRGLLRAAGHTKVDLVKMDIEGAELPVLRAPDNRAALADAWAVAIELHGEEHRRSFLHFAAEGGYRVADRGEVTFAVRTAAMEQAATSSMPEAAATATDLQVAQPASQDLRSRRQ